jgi:hypothetical protein
MKRKPNKYVLAAVAVAHLTIVALTWRDIRERPAEQIRGSKGLWRFLSAINMGNSAAYWLFGRRRGESARRPADEQTGA